jgi:hypothetical protein
LATADRNLIRRPVFDLDMWPRRFAPRGRIILPCPGRSLHPSQNRLRSNRRR